MKPITWKTILFCLIMLVLLFGGSGTAFADGGHDEYVKEVDGFVIELNFETLPIQSGGNQLSVHLHDAVEHPISAALVSVNLVEGSVDHAEEVVESDYPSAEVVHNEMNTDSHSSDEAGAHNEIESDSHSSEDTGHHDESIEIALAEGAEAGEYLGELTFTSPGDWLVGVQFTVEGAVKEATFPVHVTQSGSQWWVLGSFLMVNMVVIGAAGVLRKRHV
ncbi:MAG: hypothetical protein EHM41_20840 [Chloroflexi bacterium]|nr:MAG: hypothetical protein EHM41_20840 [Chloroflexota bacterium]